MIEIVKILVTAGATHASAAHAAVLLSEGRSVAEAQRVLVLAETAATFDVELLFAELNRKQDRAAVLRGH